MWPKRLPYFLRFIISAIDNNGNVKIKSLALCQNKIINKNSMNYGSI